MTDPTHEHHDDTEALLTSWMLSLHDKADSTRTLYADVLRRFAARLPAGTGLLDATKRDCQSYFADLRAKGRAQATMRSRWIALRNFYGWAHAEDEIAENPMATIRVERANPPAPNIPDDDDLARLLKACRGSGLWERRDLAMVRVAAATGCRVSELCGLAVADVDLANRTLVIRKGKGNKARLVRIDRETGAALDRYIRARARHRLAHLPALWLTRFGAMGAKGAQAMLPRRCDEAGIPRMHWHQLRHRFAHQLRRRGVSDIDAMTLGGWDDPTTYGRYGASVAVDRALSAYDDAGGVL
jgi:site-specific recombinase XerD